jgi:flagellar basal body rod protein FlgG
VLIGGVPTWRPGPAPGTAASGMAVAGVRLDVAAHHVANLNTEGFRPLDVITEEVVHGGVRARVVVAAPALGAEAPAPGVDLGQETVDVISARAAYAANTKILQRTRALDRSVLDLVG